MNALRTLTLGLALGALTASLAACDGDDTSSNNPPVTDGSTPVTDGSNVTDGSQNTGDGSQGTGDGSTSDGGAPDFSVFVTGLITDHTNAKDSPVPLPADGAYSDNQSQADYPASFF